MVLEKLRVQRQGSDPQFEAEMRGAARGLAHHEAGPGDARGRLAAVRHRGAAACDEQIVGAGRKDHAVRKLVVAAWLALEAEFDIAGDMILHRPAVDTNRIDEVGAIQHVFLRELIGAPQSPRLADADLRRDLRDVGALEDRRRLAAELEGIPDLAAALGLAPGQLLSANAADRPAVWMAY